MTRHAPDPEGLNRHAPGRTVVENQEHGLYVFEEAQLDAKGRPIHGYRLDDGLIACCGKLRKKEKLCESNILYSSGRCHLHGGKSPRGIASPNWKHGENSLVSTPTALRDYYQRWYQDPELIHHRHETAMVMGMLQDLLENNEEGGTPALWRRLRELADTLETARRARNRPKQEEAWQEIRVILERGVDQAERERRILSLAEAARRHKASELRRMTVESNTFTVEEAAAYYTALGAAIRRHVLDPDKTDMEKLRAISQDMAAIAGSRGVREVPAGNEAE
jgi:hypothetical protein